MNIYIYLYTYTICVCMCMHIYKYIYICNCTIFYVCRLISIAKNIHTFCLLFVLMARWASFHRTSFASCCRAQRC